MKLPKSSIKGFTLIELLVVIAIIGILAVGTITLINPIAQLQKSHDAVRKADLRQLQAALEFYRAQNGGYPASSPWGGSSSCGTPWTENNITYLQSIPCDPTTKQPYIYSSCGASINNTYQSEYAIRGCMEYNNSTDPERDGNTGAGASSQNGSATNGCAPSACTSGYSYTYINQ